LHKRRLDDNGVRGDKHRRKREIGAKEEQGGSASGVRERERERGGGRKEEEARADRGWQLARTRH